MAPKHRRPDPTGIIDTAHLALTGAGRQALRLANSRDRLRYWLRRQKRRLIGKRRQVDLALVICPVWDTFSPPIGLGYLATACERRGLRVAAHDLNIALYNASGGGDRRRWEQGAGFWTAPGKVDGIMERYAPVIDGEVRALARRQPAVVGFSVNHHNRLFTLEVARRVRRLLPAAVIVLGGPACFNQRERGGPAFPKDRFDYMVVGEGEEVLPALARRVMAGEDPAGLAGVIGTDGLTLTPLSPAPRLDLSRVRFPTYDAFDLTAYRDHRLGVMSTRGCVGVCTFCNDHAIMGRLRIRPAEDVVDEMAHHLEASRVRRFDFKDLACNGNPRHLGRIADLIVRRGLDVTWESQAIPMKNLTDDLLRRLRLAGCAALIFGLETGSDAVARSMRKYFTMPEAAAALARTRAAGISVVVNLIIGFPGEDEQELQETLGFLREHRASIDSVGCVSTCRINADSPLALRPEDFGVVVPPAPADRARDWVSTDGSNTYQRRQDHARRVLQLARQLELPVAMTNLQ